MTYLEETVDLYPKNVTNELKLPWKEVLNAINIAKAL